MLGDPYSIASGDDYWSYFFQQLATWVPIFVAALALWYAVRSDKRSRKYAKESQERAESHDKMSLRPYLYGTIDNDDKESIVRMTIFNCGAGPAVIKSIRIGLRDDSELLSLTREAVLSTLDRAGLNMKNAGYKATHTDVGQNVGLGQGRDLKLLKVGYFGDDDPDQQTTHINDTLRQIRIRVRYESVFGESWVL